MDATPEQLKKGDAMSEQEDDEDDGCGHPCDPDLACDVCAFYWERMVLQGLWDKAQHQWTERGWREITK